ncbi:MAG: hypothetical protein HKN11_18125 [Rhizobiales bacterium]|nr:hypothetical protein [Hyphomicrobiales bacterium]
MAVSLAVLASAASNLLLQSSPSLAHRVNPLNVEARIALVARQIGKAGAPDIEALSQIVSAGIRTAPADARLVSLLGLVRQQQGRNQDAQKLFRRSLALLPTEIQALLQRFLFHVERQDYSSAVRIADLVSRRWLKHWPVLEPYLAVILSDETAMRETAMRFARSRHGKSLLITSLVKQPETLNMATRLVAIWQQQGIEDLWPATNQITRRLVAEKRYAEAYILFRSMLDDQRGGETGYVFNADFRSQPTGNPFDWQFKKQAGVSMRIVRLVNNNINQDTDPGRDDRALQIKFLDNPVQFEALNQLMRLVPGDYDLAATYQTTELRAPKPLFLSVECIDSGIKLAVLPFESGTYKLNTVSNEFRIPPQGCALQRIHVFNEFLARSWSNRYSGRLTLDRIVIRKLEG